MLNFFPGVILARHDLRSNFQVLLLIYSKPDNSFFVMIITCITSISQMNELLSKFVILILTISFQSNGENLNRQDCRSSFANFVKKPFSKLTSPILVSLKSSTLDECVFECLANNQCFSINFATDSGADNMYECELLNADIFNQADKFAVSGKFHYYHNKVGSNLTFIQKLLCCKFEVRSSRSQPHHASC